MLSYCTQAALVLEDHFPLLSKRIPESPHQVQSPPPGAEQFTLLEHRYIRNYHNDSFPLTRELELQMTTGGLELPVQYDTCHWTAFANGAAVGYRTVAPILTFFA